MCNDHYVPDRHKHTYVTMNNSYHEHSPATGAISIYDSSWQDEMNGLGLTEFSRNGKAGRLFHY